MTSEQLEELDQWELDQWEEQLSSLREDVPTSYRLLCVVLHALAYGQSGDSDLARYLALLLLALLVALLVAPMKLLARLELRFFTRILSCVSSTVVRVCVRSRTTYEGSCTG